MSEEVYTFSPATAYTVSAWLNTLEPGQDVPEDVVVDQSEVDQADDVTSFEESDYQYPFGPAALPTKASFLKSFSDLGELIKNDPDSLVTADGAMAEQIAADINTLIRDSAANLALMHAINDVFEKSRWSVGESHTETPWRRSGSDNLQACAPLAVPLKNSLIKAMWTRAHYYTDSSTTESMMVANVVIPESIRVARLLLGELPETTAQLSKVISKGPKEIASLHNIYKDKFDRRVKAYRMFSDLSKLRTCPELEDLKEFERVIAARSVADWMTDAGANIHLTALYGPSSEWEIDQNSIPPYIIEEDARERLEQECAPVLRIIRECQEHTGQPYIDLTNLVEFAKSDDFLQILQSGELSAALSDTEMSNV